MTGKRIRVLIVDDSAYNRQTIAQMIENDPMLQVVGRAADGEEALAKVFQLQPDVVTLDLEMPKMDGFQFLRVMMAQRPTPVVVISGLSSRENVFRALELGALDFVSKPAQRPLAELRGIEAELHRKLQMVTQLRMLSLSERAATRGTTVTAANPIVSTVPAPAPIVASPPDRVLLIGASTGGPPAIQQVLNTLDRSLPVCVLVTQHMPPRFTTTFAERLARSTNWRVEEAKGGEPLVAGLVLVAPGGFSLIVRKQGSQLTADVVPPAADDLFVPSVDRMFASAAQAVGDRSIAMVLTGMGSDGVRGARAVRAMGGKVFAESSDTAVVFGMPQEAISAGIVDEVLPLNLLGPAVTRAVRGKSLDEKRQA